MIFYNPCQWCLHSQSRVTWNSTCLSIKTKNCCIEIRLMSVQVPLDPLSGLLRILLDAWDFRGSLGRILLRFFKLQSKLMELFDVPDEIEQFHDHFEGKSRGILFDSWEIVDKLVEIERRVEGRLTPRQMTQPWGWNMNINKMNSPLSCYYYGGLATC